MTPDYWQKVKDLFFQALERPESERETFLQTACGGDTLLLQEVLELLAHHQLTDDSFEAWQEAQLGTLLEWGAAPLQPGETLGEYTLRKELGRGGMAVVYLAERAGDGFTQQVALKVMKRGLDTEQVVARFRQERRLLATLQHPHIARLLDGGSTPQGLPYFVMEYIEGEALMDYVQRVNPPLQVRIRLFLEVLAAVSYAHGRLILHRDLKSANVLVDAQGQVKLLDFGIARLLDEENDVLTHTGQQWLTPAYASPEQIAGLPLGTASDLYQLGVVLYELITGTRPYELEGLGRIRQQEIIAQQAPAAHPALQGDLSAIVSMALRKEPERRYPSTDALADDLKRCLQGLPVLAQPDSWAYRTRRFLQRNRGAVAAAALIFLSLSLGLGVALWQAKQAAHARDRAETTMNWLVGFFDSPNPFRQQDLGPDLSVREFLTSAIPKIETDLANQPAVQADLYEAAARMYAGLTLYDSAWTLIEKAVDLQPPLSESRNRLTFQLAQYTHQPALSDSLYAETLERVQASPGQYLFPGEIWRIWGYSLVTRGETVRADSLLSLAISDLQKRKQTQSESYLVALHARAMARRDLGAYDEADSLMAQSMLLAHEIYPESHPYHAVLLNSRGVVARYQRRLDTAEVWLRQALEMQEQLLPPTHDETLTTLHNLALVLGEKGDAVAEEAIYRQNLRLKAQKYGADSYVYANTLQNLSLSIKRQNRLDEAADSLRRTYEIYRAQLPANNPRVAFPLLTLCQIEYEQGLYAASAATVRQALVPLRQGLPEGHSILADASLFLGKSLVELGKYAEAESLLKAAVAVYTQEGNPKYNLPLVKTALAKLYRAQGRSDLAAEWEAK